MKNLIHTLLFIIFLCGCSYTPMGLTNSKLYRAPDDSLKRFPFAKKLSTPEIFFLRNSIKKNVAIIKTFSPNQILNIFGFPIIIKKNNNVSIWQFRDSCTLNIVWDNSNTEDQGYTNSSILWLEALNSTNNISLKNCIFKLANI